MKEKSEISLHAVLFSNKTISEAPSLTLTSDWIWSKPTITLYNYE